MILTPPYSDTPPPTRRRALSQRSADPTRANRQHRAREERGPEGEGREAAD